MASRSKTDLHPDLVAAYNAAAAEWDKLYPNAPKPFLTATYRSNEEQTDLYAQGRTKKGKIVTNAKAGQSPHNFKPSLAFDVAFIKLNRTLDWSPKLFAKFAALVLQKSCNVAWGGNFKSIPDAPHFEHLHWRTLKP